jgi:hypothetical protein
VARKRESALAGTIAPAVDLDVIRQRSLAATLAEMSNPTRGAFMVKTDDGLGWARRILEREKRGERLPCISLEKAREALASERKHVREPGEEG